MSPREQRPLIVGLGGTTRTDSSCERAMRTALARCQERGARTVAFGADALHFPMYAPERPGQSAEAAPLVSALREARGIVIATPGYHGGISGLVKNALDYAEEMSDDDHPYLDGRAVGCIVCAHGWQATVSTLNSLRSVIHALRGWPTPLGVTINSAQAVWTSDGRLSDQKVAEALDTLGAQVVGFARANL